MNLQKCKFFGCIGCAIPCFAYLSVGRHSFIYRHAHRRFFSSLVQRAAKAHTRLKGGSLTMLLLLPGVPATGEPPPAEGVARNAAAGYKHLSQEQRDKLMAALQRQVG